MVTLEAPLLPGGAGIAVEQARARGAVRGAFQRAGVGELGSVIGKQDGEEASEKTRSGQRPQAGKGVDDGLRVVAIAEEGEHEVAVSEQEREEYLATYASAEGVHFDDTAVRCRGHERQEVEIGASEAALRIDLMLDGFSGSGLERANARHVPVFGAQQAACDIAVNGFFMDVEAIGVVGEDVMNGLPLTNQGADERVERQEFPLGDVRALAGMHEEITVACLSGAMQVVALAQNTLRLLAASVTDIGRSCQLRADLLVKVRAYRVAETTGRAALHAVGAMLTELSPIAYAARHATVGHAPERAFVAGDAPGANLSGDGRRVLSDLRGDLTDRQTVAKSMFDLQSIRGHQVFVPCHTGSFQVSPASLRGSSNETRSTKKMAD